MRLTQRVRKDAGRLSLMTAAVLSCTVLRALAQPSSAAPTPFRSEWVLMGGVGSAVGGGGREGTEREQAIYAIDWGHMIGGEHGPGLLRGRLEMMIEIAPVFLAFQSDRAEGAGFSPLMLRWNLREHVRLQPFFEIAGGVVATNQDLPENSARLNFSSHAGGGARLRVAERWGVVVGYRFQHLSNGSTAEHNPGINSNVGYLGLAYKR
jgi:hypothetical protein